MKNPHFWTVVLEKTLKVPWTARRYNQPILKEMCPECLLGRLMLKLKLQHFGHLMGRADSLENSLRAGGERLRAGGESDEMLGWHHQLNGDESESIPGCCWWTGRPGVLWFMRLQRVRHDWATDLNWIHFYFIFVYGVSECSNFFLLHAAVQFSLHHLLNRLFSFFPLYILASFVVY